MHWLSFIFLFLYPSLFALEQKELFEHARFWGRGLTGTASYHTEEASFLNPASLAEAPDNKHLRPISFDASIGKNMSKSYSQFSEQLMGSDKQREKLFKQLQGKFGQEHFLKYRFSLLGFRLKNVEAVLFQQNTLHFELLLPEDPLEMEWSVDGIKGGNFSFGFSLTDTLDLGITVRPMQRWYMQGRFGQTEAIQMLPPKYIQMKKFNPSYTGFGVGGDLGLIWKPYPNFRLALMGQNIGDMGYFRKKDKLPPLLRSKYSLGLLFRTSLKFLDLDFFLDYHDLRNQLRINPSRPLHAGFELGFKKFSHDHDVGFTIGVNEGYGTWGIFADILFFRIAYASYIVSLAPHFGAVKDKRSSFAWSTSKTF